MAKRRKFWPGRIFRATAPFRIGMGSGPERNGLCAKGDYFIVLETDSGDDSPCLMCVSETQRRAAVFKSYPTVEFLRPATRREIALMFAHLFKVEEQTTARWGSERL